MRGDWGPCHTSAGCMALCLYWENDHIMMYMDVTGYIWSNHLLICGIGVWFGTSGMAVPMCCMCQSIFCMARNFVFDGRSVTRGPWETFLIMFGRLLMRATKLPRKMMGGVRLRFGHCVASTTPSGECTRHTPPRMHNSVRDCWVTGCLFGDLRIVGMGPTDWGCEAHGVGCKTCGQGALDLCTRCTIGP